MHIVESEGAGHHLVVIGPADSKWLKYGDLETYGCW
jgi:hypothetical protein